MIRVPRPVHLLLIWRAEKTTDMVHNRRKMLLKKLTSLLLLIMNLIACIEAKGGRGGGGRGRSRGKGGILYIIYFLNIPFVTYCHFSWPKEGEVAPCSSASATASGGSTSSWCSPFSPLAASSAVLASTAVVATMIDCLYLVSYLL